MSEEAEQREAIFASCRTAGLEPTALTWLDADLALRRFARVHTASERAPTLIARVEAPEDPAGRPAGSAPEPPHEPIRALLAGHGLPVPQRFGGDARAGIELLEDVGDRSLCDAAGALPEATRRALHREACAWIPRIQRIEAVPGVAAFERRLDAALFAYKGDLFARHALAARGRATSASEAEVVREAFARIAREMEDAPRRLAHRDYQSGNLFVVPDAPEGARLRMIDLQGAFLAPPEYDLVCLLRDSYIELSEPEVAGHVEAVREALPDAPEAEVFARRFDLLTLTRKGKDVARFLYAAHERGDERFLAHVPATVRMLHRAARRSAERDASFGDLAALVCAVPELPCAR
jgi:aminoglycoside/choline kinase family phosphotransferase